MGDGDARMAVAVVEAEVDRAVGADADRGVARAGGAAGDRAHRPGEAVVGRHRHPLAAAAALVGDVGGAVRRHLDVAVEPPQVRMV